MLPTITPRFALSCSKDLLKQLGEIAKRNDVHIQSHISENLQEIQVVRNLFKTSYAGAYDEAGLLTKKVTIYIIYNLYYTLYMILSADRHGTWCASGG